MQDPTGRPTGEEAGDDAPNLDPETLKDLELDDAEAVRGGYYPTASTNYREQTCGKETCSI